MRWPRAGDVGHDENGVELHKPSPELIQLIDHCAPNAVQGCTTSLSTRSRSLPLSDFLDTIRLPSPEQIFDYVKLPKTYFLKVDKERMQSVPESFSLAYHSISWLGRQVVILTCRAASPVRRYFTKDLPPTRFYQKYDIPDSGLIISKVRQSLPSFIFLGWAPTTTTWSLHI